MTRHLIKLNQTGPSIRLCVFTALACQCLLGCNSTPEEAVPTVTVESEMQKIRIGMTRSELIDAIGGSTSYMGLGVLYYERWDFLDGTSFYPKWESPNDSEPDWDANKRLLVAYIHYRTDSGDHLLNTSPYGELSDPIEEAKRLEELNNFIRDWETEWNRRIDE